MPALTIAALTNGVRIRHQKRIEAVFVETSPNTQHTTQAPFFNTANQAARRKIARDVAAFYDDMGRECDYEPIERRTAFAISMRLYERAGQPCDTPRGVSLSAIGTGLSSRSDDEKARVNTARNRVGQLFNQAIPRTGYQILTRYKAEEDSGKPHEYCDHLLPIAALYSERLREETDRILASKGLDKKGKREKIAEARARLVAEAVACLPKCDTALVAPDGKTYAYVSAPEAQAYCKQKTAYTARSYTYTPPAPAADYKRPLSIQDLNRIEHKIRTTIEDELDKIQERNSFDEARLFSKRINVFVPKVTASWEKVAGASEKTGEAEKRINQRVIEIVGVALPDQAFSSPEIEGVTPQNFGGVSSDKLLDVSEIEEPVFESALEAGDCLANGQKATVSIAENGTIDAGLSFSVEAPAADFVQKRAELEEIAPAAEASGASAETDLGPSLAASPAVRMETSISFETSIEAATFYARDGWHVLPICNFDPERGHCTADWHNKDAEKFCTGKKPLVKGTGKPGDGYTAATRDLSKIRDWFERQYPSAGVSIRLDGHALIDCDPKDGGLESYEFLRDTFDLPDTLTAITQSGGRHYVFKLPDDLPKDDRLKSWTKIGDKIGLGGIDLKVDKWGLMCVEPTRGSKGIYRWVDPTFSPATLPREVCDSIQEIGYKDGCTQVKGVKSARVFLPSVLRPLDMDQAKYFRDMPHGERHKRLLKIGTHIRIENSASAAEIADIMRWHAARFSEPLNDEDWIVRTSRSIEERFVGKI